MKKTFVIAVLMALTIVGFSQEYIQQPTAINTWTYVWEYGVEFPYNKNISLQYDERGNLSYYYHVINYPSSPYTNTMWFTHDALNRLTFKETSYQEYNQFGTHRYYYTYDELSNLTECLVMKRDRESMYNTDEFIIDSKDVYQYENGKKTRLDHFKGSTLVLQYYFLYEYSDNDDWFSETKYDANDQPLTRTEYAYSGTHDPLSKTVFNWSAETQSWLVASQTEFFYEDGHLIEKRITDSEQKKQLYNYDENGNCTRILFQTLVDGVYVDQNRANYLYDENNLCTNANAERWNDTTWVLGGFPSGTFLFFDELYADANDAIGTLSNCTRAEVTEYITTPNPKYLQTMPNLEGEWYYEITNANGSITYQYLQCAGDTAVAEERPKIIVRTNTIYDDKGKQQTVTHEYVYERDSVVYWWNKDLQEFTTLYDLTADVGDEWVINVGTESLVMHVDAVSDYEYDGRTLKMLSVSDENDLFSGDIVCGIGHLTSFFPERLMNRGRGYRVKGIRCYWQDGELVFKLGEKDCDEVYQEYHNQGVDETETSGFRIYPNPANDVIVVETPEGATLQEYRITNLLGQTMLTGTSQTINVSSLPSGMYFLTLGTQTLKFTKQ
ncbi:MAG: T9SS type A sorting domain-containing protein [Bacteroidales bacterium]|nr:T9SS type A sorting domain-containing protein [Bacteroidales bacterium]